MKILFLTHRLPYAPNRGDRIRAYFLLREMSSFADVSLFSLVHDDEEAARAGDVPFAREVAAVRVPGLVNRIRAAASLLSNRPLTHALLDAPDARRTLQDLVRRTTPDLVVAFCSGMARFALEPPLGRIPFVLDMVDVDSVKWAELAARTRGPRRWIYTREARTLRAFEKVATARARLTLLVNGRERASLAARPDHARIEVVPNGVDVDAFRPPAGVLRENTVVFCGVMNYGPNEEGVIWFAKEVWPRVRANRPDARFSIVGANPTRRVQQLAAHDPSIVVVGVVESVQPYLWRSSVSVAPLQVARGLQNKVLEALAADLPVVVTPAVYDGLPESARPGCAVAGDSDAFAAAVIAQLDSAPAGRRTRQVGRVERLGWTEQLKPLRRILEDAAGVGTHPLAAAR